MRIRTFFWHDRVISPTELALRRLLHRDHARYFTVGNAGDLMAETVIRRRYGCPATNVSEGGHRLLVVGSVVHRMKDGDILCGIGVKTRDVPSASEVHVEIVGLRGPISMELLAAAGHDVSGVKFLLDPGLLIRFEVTDEAALASPRGAIFIPHYRERRQVAHSLPPGVRFVDIDGTPQSVARQILNAGVVFTSSLHGVVFSHALQRPCVLVRPQTAEPLLKYQDYFAAMGIPFPKPLDSIRDASPAVAPTSPAEVHFAESDVQLPQLHELVAKGIAIAG